MAPAEQDRPDVAEQRERWRKMAPTLDAKHLVFIDETGTKTNMTRRYARSSKLAARAWSTCPPTAQA